MLILQNLDKMIVRLLMILLSDVIHRGARDTQDACDLLIILAVMRQEQGPCTVDVSRIFLTVSDIRGQEIIFVLGSLNAESFPCHRVSCQSQYDTEGSKLKDLFERPLSVR